VIPHLASKVALDMEQALKVHWTCDSSCALLFVHCQAYSTLMGKSLSLMFSCILYAHTSLRSQLLYFYEEYLRMVVKTGFTITSIGDSLHHFFPFSPSSSLLGGLTAFGELGIAGGLHCSPLNLSQ